MATQWRCLALADGRIRVIGLDYGAVKSAFELGADAITPEIWSDLQVIERAALAELNRSER